MFLFERLYFQIGLTMFVLAFGLTAAACRWFPRLGLMDRPRKYGLLRAPIPYYGGLALAVSFTIGALVFVPLTHAVVGLLFGMFVVVGVSFLDDVFDVSPLARLAAQAVAGVIAVGFGIAIHGVTNPFSTAATFSLDRLPFSVGSVTIFLVSAAVTVAWIIFVINSVNFFDGIPGLTSGISAIASLALFLLSIKTGHVVEQSALALLTIILFGCTLAFLCFDLPPSVILMGDTGSMMLGYLLAIFAIFAGGKLATAFVVLGIPLFDAVWTIVRRIARGVSPFKGDLEHFHHRMMKAGFSQKQTIAVMYGVSAIFGLIAVFEGALVKVFLLGGMALFLFGMSVYCARRAAKV